MKKANVIHSLLLILAIPALIQAQEIPADPNLRTGKLPNGQTYYIRHNHLPKGRADFYLVQKVGSIQEEESQRGLAHFLEHMAFNGTKNFPGNSLISELEKKGIRFGANINASTSFDETIYKLNNIPVEREGIADTALLVLHDWAGFLTLDDKETDDERGVIREEWRLSASAALRVLQKDIYPAILAGTPYPNRFPIGNIDVINNFKYQELRDYYKKWYRPDLQGIIVVGDIDVDQIEKKIKKMFTDIVPSANPAERVYYHVPDNKEPIIAYGTDKEMSYTTVSTYWKMDEVPRESKSTLQWYKTHQVEQVVSALLGSRFNELRERQDAPISSAYAYFSTFEFVNLKPAVNIMLYPKDKSSILTGFNAIFQEIERVKRFGFTKGELDDVIIGAMTQVEKAYTDRHNKENREYLSEYIKLFLNNEPSPGPDWEYQAMKKILSELTIETVNEYAKKVFGDKNMVIYATAPEADKELLPGKEDILKAWSTAKSAQLSPYEYKLVSTQIIDKKLVAGKVVKTEKKPFGFTQWTLSNGVKVQFKKTDYKEDKLSLRAYSPGGVSLVSDKDLPSARNAGMALYGGFGNFSMEDLGKANKGKDMFVNTNVGEFGESIDGSSSIKDRERLFEMIHLKMTAPRKNQHYFDTWKKSTKEGFKDRYTVPELVMKDSVDRIMSNYHPRAVTLSQDSTLVDNVDYDKVLELYKQRFADASDFTFFITGNVPADSIRRLAELYLGSLPSTYSKEKPKDHGIYPPTGKITRHFAHQMITPKSSVNVNYTGVSIPYNLENSILMDYVGRILGIKYIETMREKEGGVYYVRSSGWIDKEPKDHFTFHLEFATDPDPVKKEKLMKLLYAGIDDLMSNGPSAESVDKAKGNILKIVDEWHAEKTGNYWNYAAYFNEVNGFDLYSGYEKVARSVTPEMVKAFAKKLFTQGNIVEVIMDPQTPPADKKGF
jgi:zinc protease